MAKRSKSFALAVRNEPARASESDDAREVDPTPVLIKEARERWNRCDDAEDGQRARMVLAKNFRVGNQWPEPIRIQRQGGQAISGQPAMPARPCLTIDRLSQPARQISNTIKTANFAITVLPNGFGADSETADIFKGYLRYVQNKARGESPVEWAADQAVEGGIGWFRLRTEYVYDNPEGIPEEALLDQELRLERIPNNLSVYCDPWAVKPTRSDARFMFVTEDLAKSEFTRQYPNADLKGLEDFAATGDCPKGWVEADSIRIAEYWRVTFEDVTEGPRTFRVPRVKGSKITATQELETWDWVGSRIPLIPVLGEEFNIDGKPYLRGIIEPGMDAQRMVNYTYSGAVEIFALGSKSQYVVADDQLAEYKNIWQTANTMNWAYLPYKAASVSGTLLPPPKRDTSEAPIQAAALLLQVSEEGIKATTGWYDSGLGSTDSRAVSGRAKQSEIQQSQLGSSNYPDNVKRALIYAGEQMVEIAPKITRKGQILQILGLDDKPEQVVIGQPFVQENGRAIPIQEEERARYEAGLVKFYDFSKGRYAVTVSVGEAEATKREEGAAALGELIPHLPPEMAMVATPDYVEQLSFPGAHQIAEKLRKALPPQLQEQDGKGPDPEKQAMQQQIMALQQALESKVAEKQAEMQAKGQFELQKTQFEGQLELQREQLRAQVEIEKARIQAQTQLTVAEIKANSEEAGHQIQREEMLIGNDHELRVQARDHDHERGIVDAQAQIASQQADQQHAQALEAGEVGHRQALEQGAASHQQNLEAQAAKPQPGANA